jgi:hypothetical protein
MFWVFSKSLLTLSCKQVDETKLHCAMLTTQACGPGTLRGAGAPPGCPWQSGSCPGAPGATPAAAAAAVNIIRHRNTSQKHSTPALQDVLPALKMYGPAANPIQASAQRKPVCSTHVQPGVLPQTSISQ